MSPQPDYSDWLTIAEATAALGGIGERTLYRMARGTETKPPLIQKALRKRLGQSAITVFHPGDVEKVRAQQLKNANRSFVMPRFMAEAEPMERRGAQPDRVPPPYAGLALELTEAVPALLATVGQMADRFQPLFLTTRQAVRYTGLTAEYLDRLVRENKLRRIDEGIRGFRYRRRDLDAL
jgi:hypothetical protein